MKLIFDVNIWIDVAARPAGHPESVEALRLLQKRAHTIGFPLCGYTTVHYIVSQLLKPKAAKDYLAQLQDRGIRMLTFGPQEVAIAQSLSIKDHEDACILATALTNRYDYVITRNLKDFKSDAVKVATPKQVINWPSGS